MALGLLLLALFAVGFSMVANRLSATVLTAPMIFIFYGFLLSTTGLFPSAQTEQILHLVAEIALVILLFLDAAQIDLRVLGRQHTWPARMLVIGLPLTIVIGTATAWMVFPELPLVALALIAAILAPTDAALGQAVVTNPDIPERPRRALTVESGLNDGLALPAVLLFASLTAEVMDQSGTNWIVFAIQQLVFGPLTGIVVGLAGGSILIWAKNRQTTAEPFEGIGAIALAGSAYLGATQLGGNGFIAAFVAGLCFGHVVQGRCKFVYEFTESEGLLLTWGAFFLVGLALVPHAIQHLSLEMLVLILISLFAVRPIAIWVALIATDASAQTRFFFGWFGPRGLATALFALLVVPLIDDQLADFVLIISINTVWISALLHGLTATPGARWYAARIQKMGDCAESRPLQISDKPKT